MADNDDRLGAANFAEGDEEARRRTAARLTQDRKPTTAASTGTWVNWASEEAYLGQPWDTTRIPLAKLEQMRRDPILAFALMFVKVPLIRAPWYIKCADPKIASAVDASLRRIYGRFVLAYTNSFDYGFSPMVKRFTYEDNPDWTYVEKDDPFGEEQLVWTDKTVKPLVWKPFTALNPRGATPHWNSKGEFNGIDFTGAQSPNAMSSFGTSGYPTNWGRTGGQKRIPDVALDWALWATNDKDSVFGSYWGYPRIGPAYRFWWAYWYRFGVSDRAFEKWGDPPVVVFHPNDPLAVGTDGLAIDHTSEALALAESLRGGANVAMPSSVVTGLDEKATNVREWWMEQMEVKTNFSSINEIFEYLDVQKLRAVLVPEQALIEGKGGTSSRNVAATFGDLFAESQAVVKTEIDDHLNRFVIPQFVELNFGPNAPRAEIVTTGFESSDVESMREVVRLLGQRKTLSMVDEREIFERLGLPTVSRKEMNRRLAEAAVEVEEGTPPKIEAGQGSNEFSGINDEGRYYGARERIVLGAHSNTPYVVERVDELPISAEAPAAYFSVEDRTLYVRKDADPDAVKGYVLEILASKAVDADSPLPEEGLTALLSQFQQLDAKMTELSEKDGQINVELVQQPRPPMDLEFERNESGLITRVVEKEVENG